MIQIEKIIKRIAIQSFGFQLPISLVKSKYQIPNRTEILENLFKSQNYVYCNINFDDQCPVYKQIDGRDYGGKINAGISRKLQLFLEQNPDVAITSFVIPNFKGNTKNFKDKFLLSNLEHSEWVTFYTELAKKYNLEYALHGYFHLQKENPFFQPYTEFAFKSHDQAINCIGKSIDVFKSIGWPVAGFRQPGWDISSTINLPEIAKMFDMKYLAANSYDAGYNSGGIERVSNYYPTIIDSVINFPQNIELDWPIDKILKKINFLVGIKALISIKAHFVDRDICNCLNQENIVKLNEITDYIRSNFNDRIKFATLNSISKLIKITNNQ